MAWRRWLLPALASALLIAGACGTARRSEPIVGPLDTSSPEVRDGERVFMAHCHTCHPGGEAGLGPALNNKPLPDFMISLQVRHGFGVMPAFDVSHLSDHDLTQLLAYLRARRAQRAP